MMGNILYYILTKKWIFEKRLNQEAVQSILDGHPTKIPGEILNSTNPATKAMIKGIEFAWVHKPSKRPPAKEIADFLKKQLTLITGNEALDYRVLVPPLPPDYDYSDRDFQRNFKVGYGA
jgi:hypothetical protein